MLSWLQIVGDLTAVKNKYQNIQWEKGDKYCKIAFALILISLAAYFKSTSCRNAIAFILLRLQ